MNPYLFVYGTLRFGAGNEMARFLRANATLLGEGSMAGHVKDVGGYPGAFFDETSATKVYGDIFRMHRPEFVLEKLDAYEGIGAGFSVPFEYERSERPVWFGDVRVTCWVYLYNW